ncbi:hypothetical protein SCUP515_12573 [Seiridium cupressi]
MSGLSIAATGRTQIRPARPAKKSFSTRPKVRPGDYTALIKRYYEPCILLKVLGQTRGRHTTVIEEKGTLQFSRRRLLGNLSYLCDYAKGGITTVAIGLEEQPNNYNLWVASNGSKELDKMVKFLTSVLEDIRAIISPPSPSDIDPFVRKCIEFSSSRVKKEGSILFRLIDICEKRLAPGKSETDLSLICWLRKFIDKTSIDLCCLAYEQRNAPEMKEISYRGRIEHGDNHQTPGSMVYTALRHTLGRLAHHVRAPKQVIADATKFHNLFDEDVSFVKRIEPMACVAPPEADERTTPLGILSRMVQLYDPRKERHENNMILMDQRFDLSKKIRDQYEDPNFQPCVHSEIQVLEHFYDNKLRFASDDRFIGCSKPACYCCCLYFKAHPAGCVEPRSHQNIWPNWGPPDLPGGSSDPKYTHQRDILNKMLESIRKEALDQIENQAAALQRHPDSTSGFTPSVLSDGIRNWGDDSLEEHLTSLKIGAGDFQDENSDNDGGALL